MCGILGVISKPSSNQSLDDNQIIAMRDTMIARGPDGAGLFRENEFAFAHRRLAIRDLHAGQQPWLSQSGRFVIVFNGEIYNDDELANLLKQKGVQLKTKCDTETLAESWAIWGPGCIEKLRGMFAFSVLDRITKDYWLVRDRCGIKPLFYSHVGSDFVFASSIAAIKKHPHFQAKPNFSTIRHYLQTLRTTLDNQTVYENVYTVRPAEIIRVRDHQLAKQVYWSLPKIVNKTIRFDDAVDQLEQTIQKSVSFRLKSDVPVGMMISGGVDSNTLAAFTRQQRTGSIVGVCGGGVDQTDDQQNGDVQFAGKCAQEFDFDFSAVQLSDNEYLSTWESLIAKYETPISTPTDAIIFRVAQKLKKSVGVAIGGEGADEAFCGYTVPHWSGHDFDRSHHLTSLPPIAAQQARESLMRQYGRTAFESSADHYLITYGLIPLASQRALFRKRFWADCDSENTISNYYQNLFSADPNLTMAQRYARVLFKVNLESLLGRLDSATMAASLEARVPFTDHILIEQAFQLPHHFKIDVCPTETKPWLSSLDLAQRNSLRSKRVLRAVASLRMSPHLAQRPKMSFPTPLNGWLNRNWKTWIAKKLARSQFAREIFNPSALAELNHVPQSHAMWKWPVMNTVLWGDACFS